MITRFVLQVVQEKKIQKEQWAWLVVNKHSSRFDKNDFDSWLTFKQIINQDVKHLQAPNFFFLTAENLNIFGFRQLKTSHWALGRLNADQKGKVEL